MAERDLTDDETATVAKLVESGVFDAVLAARVQAELRYLPAELAEEYVRASAWLIMARAGQYSALRKIQAKAKGLPPPAVQGLMALWAFQAQAIAEQLVQQHAKTEPAPPPADEDAAPPA